MIVSVVFSVNNNYDEKYFYEWLKFISSNSRLVIAALALAASTYSNGLGEDMEHSCSNLFLIRGGIIPYVMSKSVSTMLSGFVAMIGGIGLTCIYKLLLLSAAIEEVDYDANGLYVSCLYENKLIKYIILVGVHYAALAGIVGMMGMLISLYNRSRLMVYAAPVALIMICNLFLQRFFPWEVGATVSLYAIGVIGISDPVGFMSIPVYYTEIALWFIVLTVWTYKKFEKKVRFGG